MPAEFAFAPMDGTVYTALPAEKNVYPGTRQLEVMASVLGTSAALAAAAAGLKVDSAGRRTNVFASAARTADATSDAIYTKGARGVRATLTATALAATPSITFTIQGYDATAAAWYDILTSGAIATASPTTSTLTVYPGIAVTANVSASTVLPDKIRIFVDHSDTDSITYSVGLDWLD